MSTQPSNLNPASTLPDEAVRPSETQTAANHVYNIPELRRRILLYLSNRDLAVCMRVEEKGMAMVAQVLYHTVKICDSQEKMNLSTPRRRMYCESVTVVDGSGFCAALLPVDLRETLRARHGLDMPVNPFGIDWWLSSYQPSLIEVLVPYLQLKHPRLRSLYLGKGSRRGIFSTSCWTVNVRPIDHIARNSATGPNVLGRVDHVQTLRFGSDALPPSSLDEGMPSELPGGYELQTRFDLYLEDGYESEDASEYEKSIDERPKAAWITALAENPIFAKLHKGLDLNDLPVDLGLISRLYQRQIDAGHTVRLVRIKAVETIPFSIEDFASFARIALKALRRLYLTSRTRTSGIYFKDIPNLIGIVRENLPALLELHIGIDGLDSSESVCKGMLRRTTLNDGGRIKKLRIYTSNPYFPLFNTLRALSPLIHRRGIIEIGGPREAEFPDKFADTDASDVLGKEYWDTEATTYLYHLRSFTGPRRFNLTTADFSKLGFTDLLDVLAITFDDTNRPRHRDHTQALGMLETASLAKTHFAESLLPALEHLSTISRQVANAFEVPGTSNRLSHLREQLTAVDGVEQAGEELAEILRATEMAKARLEEAIEFEEGEIRQRKTVATLSNWLGGL